MALPWFEEQPSGGSQALQAEHFPSCNPASSHGAKTQALPMKKIPQRYGSKSRSRCLVGWVESRYSVTAATRDLGGTQFHHRAEHP